MVDKRENPGLQSTMQDAIAVSDGLIRVRDAWKIWYDRDRTPALNTATEDILGMLKKVEGIQVSTSLEGFFWDSVLVAITDWSNELTRAELDNIHIRGAEQLFAWREGAAIEFNSKIILSNQRRQQTPLTFRR